MPDIHDLITAGSGFHETVVKLADESKSFTTATVIDDELVVTLPVGTYPYTATLAINSNSTADFRWLFTGTATFTGTKHAGTFSGVSPAATTAIGSSAVGGTNGNDQLLTVIGVVEVTVAGTFGLGWGQSMSNVGPTIVQKGSKLTVEQSHTGGS